MKVLPFLFTLFFIQAVFAQNLIQNGNFESGPSQQGSASLFVANGVPNWHASHGNPNIWTTNGNKSANVVLGSGIYTSCNFVAGQTYRIAYRIGYNANCFIKAANGLTPNNSFLPNPQSQLIREIPATNFNPQWHTQYMYFTPSQNYSQLWFYSTISVVGTGGSLGAVVDEITVVSCSGYSAAFSHTACRTKSGISINCTNNPVTTNQNNWTVFQEDTPTSVPTSAAIATATGDNPVISVTPSKRYLIVAHTIANNGCSPDVSVHVIDRQGLQLCGLINESIEPIRTKGVEE